MRGGGGDWFGGDTEGNDRASLSLAAVMPEGFLGFVPDTIIP